MHTRFGDVAHASRQSKWRAITESLCGHKSSELIDALARQPDGSRTVVVTLGESQVGAGQLAASLILREVCCSDEVRMTPVQILVAPDRLSARQGYLGFQIAISEVRALMNAWRVRAVGAGHSPGDFTAVEHSLLRRAKRGSASAASESSENLHLFFPAYRFADETSLATVASRDHLRADESLPALTFVDSPGDQSPDLHELGIVPDWIIVDCTVGGREFAAEEILSWHDQFPHARHVCLVPGLSHRLTDKLRGRGFRVTWLRDTTEETSADAIQQRIKCAGVEANADSEDLRRLLSITSEVRRGVRDGEAGVELAALNTLRSAIHVITSLPVERAYYDAAAVERFTVPTTDELLESLSQYELRLAMSRPTTAAAIEEARSILSSLAGQADTASDRKRVLLEHVNRAIENNSGLYVVVRNRTSRAAVEACMMDTFDTDLSDLNTIGVRIESRRDLRAQSLSPSVPLLWTSYAGFADLDVILGISHRPIVMLLNQFEREMFAHDLRSWANRADAAQQGSEALGVAFPGKRRFLDGISGLASHVRKSGTLFADTKVSNEIFRLFEDVTATWLIAPSVSTEERGGILRPALTVNFQSGAQSYFHESSVVTVIHADAEEPAEVSVKELMPGDRVVFVNKTVGRTIYELMQEHLGQSPLVGAAAQMVGLWHRAISAAQSRSGLSPHEIQKRLRDAGSSITTVATVRSWLRGVVLGPQNLNDVDRFAGILGIGQRDPTVLENIKTSIRSLRNVYRQFAKLVYRAILTGGTGRRLSESEQALVEEHGISLSDLRDAIAIETVMTIAAQAEPRPASLIGQRVNE